MAACSSGGTGSSGGGTTDANLNGTWTYDTDPSIVLTINNGTFTKTP